MTVGVDVFLSGDDIRKGAGSRRVEDRAVACHWRGLCPAVDGDELLIMKIRGTSFRITRLQYLSGYANKDKIHKRLLFVYWHQFFCRFRAD